MPIPDIPETDIPSEIETEIELNGGMYSLMYCHWNEHNDQSYHPCKSILYQPMMQQGISWKKWHIETPDKPIYRY